MDDTSQLPPIDEKLSQNNSDTDAAILPLVMSFRARIYAVVISCLCFLHIKLPNSVAD